MQFPDMVSAAVWAGAGNGDPGFCGVFCHVSATWKCLCDDSSAHLGIKSLGGKTLPYPRSALVMDVIIQHSIDSRGAALIYTSQDYKLAQEWRASVADVHTRSSTFRAV